jgi:hypothetical protein
MPSTKLDQQNVIGEQLQQQAHDQHQAALEGAQPNLQLYSAYVFSAVGAGWEALGGGEEQEDAYAAQAQPVQRVRKPFEDIM